MRTPALLSILLFTLSSQAADMLRPHFDLTTPQPAATAPPLRAQATAAAIVATASGATTSDLAQLRASNASGDGPVQLGVVRELDSASIATDDSSIHVQKRWRGAVQVEGATRIRVRLDGVAFPAGTRLWIYGATGEAIAIDTALVQNGTLWTPSIAAGTATIEVETPGNASFRIGAVVDVRSAAEVAPNGTECITDLSCHNVDPNLARGVAYYEYVGGTRLLACTGTLLNNAKEDGTPYFLTAAHCVKNQTQASTVETYWDYRSATCGGAAPPLASLQKVTGATLLVTSSTTDVTLLKLAAVPSGRAFLGWDANPIIEGTTLFHISHPNANPARYSTSIADMSATGCSTSPRPAFLYSRPVIGATDGGSSGSAVMRAGGYVVGQLKAGCGPEATNPCNRANFDVDGAFAASYAQLQPFLNPAPACSACTPDSTTACLLGNRFKVTVQWTDAQFGSGAGKPIRFTENTPQTHPQHGPIIETAFFAFYDFFPNSVETMVKMTKGVGVNDKFWVFLTGFTGAEYRVTVTDTSSCATWEKSMPANANATTRDYEAFSLP